MIIKVSKPIIYANDIRSLNLNKINNNNVKKNYL